MKNIELIGSFDPGASLAADKDRDVREIYKGARRQLLEVRLKNSAILPKHKAAEPITVFCLSGSGTFRAGGDLEDAQKMTPGTLITLEPNVEHEAVAEPNLHLLVTKFREN